MAIQKNEFIETFSDIKITIWVASGKPNIDHLILKDLRLDTENNRKSTEQVLGYVSPVALRSCSPW